MSTPIAVDTFTLRRQAAAIRQAVRLLRLLGPVRSSNLAGRLARSIGPLLRVSRVADANLCLALPALDKGRRRAVVRAVWDNLGRNVGELPHLGSFRQTEDGPGWEVVGGEHLEALRKSGRPALFFSGHLGNWEMILPIAAQLGLTVAGFYRASSNIAVDGAVQAMRRAGIGTGGPMFAKGAQGAREAIRHLRAGGSLGLLVDQKMNDGVRVPFFGREAMTAPALAQLALRFDVPVVPVRVQRLGPGRFRMVCEPPLAVPRTGVRSEDVLAMMRAANEVLERWITEEPGAWLWLHRRWPKGSGRLDGVEEDGRSGAPPLDPTGGSAPGPAVVGASGGGRWRRMVARRG